jgi:hypothetical protein
MQTPAGLLMLAFAFAVIVSVTLFGKADRVHAVTTTGNSQYDDPYP